MENALNKLMSVLLFHVQFLKSVANMLPQQTAENVRKTIQQGNRQHVLLHFTKPAKANSINYLHHNDGYLLIYNVGVRGVVHSDE